MGRLAGISAAAILLHLSGAVAFSQPAPTRLIVRFSPEALDPPPGEKAGSIERFTFKRPGLRQSLRKEGVEHLERLFPAFAREDKFSKNLIGEPVLLEDLSDFYVVSLRQGSHHGAEQRLRMLPGVRHVGVSQPRHLLSVFPNDPLFSKQWGSHNTEQTLCSPYSYPALVEDADMNLPEAWSITTGSAAVRVGILDSGIWASHEDFGGRVNLANGKSFTPQPTWNGDQLGCIDYGECVSDLPDLPMDDDKHGTGVAGIIAASGNNGKGIAGVAWGVTPISIRVAYCGVGKSCWSAMGIDWARSQAIPILNMSYEGPDDAAERAAARNALYAGQLLVAAMGNNNANTRVYPAGYTKLVCAVGAYYANGERWDEGSGRGSNWGWWIDLAAPGGNQIAAPKFTTPSGSPNQYFDLAGCTNDFGGTSSAAPAATGVAALLLSKYPGLLGEDLLEVMRRTALDKAPAGFDEFSGHGHVRADAALNYLAAPKEVLHVQATGMTIFSTQGPQMVTFNNVPDLPSNGEYLCREHRMRKTVTFPSSFSSMPETWVRSSGSLGAAPLDPYDYDEEVNWGRIVPGSLTTSGCTLETFVYEIYVPGEEPYWFPSSTSDAKVAITAVGSIPPAPITSLAPDVITPNEIWFTWTAPGDDGDTGTAASYDLRYSLQPITAENFAAATSAPAPAPAAAGTPQAAGISGLQACTQYHFAIKATDDAGNTSALGDVLSLSTMCGPGPFANRRETIPLEPELKVMDSNPVSGEANILLSLPLGGAGEPAQLAVFDLSGRRVRDFAGGLLKEGSTRLTWDLRADDGQAVGSGIYFLRLTSRSTILSRALVVMR